MSASPASDPPATQDRIPDVRRFRVTAFAIGLVAGVFSVLFGVGGGLIMVPAMALLLHIRQHRAVGTSLAVIIPTALAGAYRYAMADAGPGQATLSMSVVLWLALGGIVGGVIGATIANLVGAKQLRRIFGVFVILTGVYMIAQINGAGAHAVAGASAGVRALELVGVGVLVGVVSGLLGVGGGVVMVPALALLLGYGQHLAQGTSLAVIIPVALSGTFAHARKGNVLWAFALWLSLGAVLGAWISGDLVQKISDERLRMLFGIFMICVGLSMMVVKREAPAASPAGAEE